MSDEQRLDPKRDELMAALYGELPAAEMGAFEARLEADTELRREWEELQEARSFLGRALEVDPVAELPEAARGRVLQGPWARRLVVAASGFAAASVLFAALLFGGLRVDRTPRGLLVGFSPDAAQVHEPSVRPAAVRDQPLTRAEFAAFAELLVDTTASRLDALAERQATGQVLLNRELYNAQLVQQSYYDDLRTRLEFAAWRPEAQDVLNRIERKDQDEQNWQ